MQDFKNFDEASKAAEEMFNAPSGPEQTDENAVQNSESQNSEQSAKNIETNTADTEAQATEPQQTEQQPMSQMETAVKTAETAAMAASETDKRLQQVLQENEELKEQYVQMQNTLKQMSEKQEEHLIGESVEMPTLDLDNIAFADDKTKQQMQSDYAHKMAEYVKGDIMKEIAPFVQQAKEGLYEKEKNTVINELANIPELHGIKEMLPRLERIISNSKALSSDAVPIDERYTLAYAIANGVDASNAPAPKEPTAEELYKIYLKNPELQELIEKKRVEDIKQNQQVPAMSASSGAVNAAPTIKEKPKNLREAFERASRYFED